jgi:low affinity Fe/Cu permease
MKAFQKWLLALAVTGLVVGVFVSLSHADLAPAWMLALPLGVILTGLFLVTLLLQNEVTKFDAEERFKIEQEARRDRFSGFDTPNAFVGRNSVLVVEMK